LLHKTTERTEQRKLDHSEDSRDRVGQIAKNAEYPSPKKNLHVISVFAPSISLFSRINFPVLLEKFPDLIS